MQVTIEEHNPAWLEEFARVKRELDTILIDVPIIGIEHVGSTSIPGLVAKPILDTTIIVTPANIPLASSALVKAGYTAKGDLGIPFRYAFRQPGYKSEYKSVDAALVTGDGDGDVGGEMKRQTYVTVEDCISTRNQRDVKRVLLENAELRREYGDTKRRLVEGGVKDVDEYCMGKNEIVLKILKAAGWNEDDLEEVRKVNS